MDVEFVGECELPNEMMARSQCPAMLCWWATQFPCVLCVGSALQCRFCWAIFLGNSGDVTRMIPRSDVNGCPSHKIPSHHNHIFVLYNRRSSRPAHGTEATTISGARPSGEFKLHATHRDPFAAKSTSGAFRGTTCGTPKNGRLFYQRWRGLATGTVPENE